MPPTRSSPAGYEHSRRLRKQLTPAEERLWEHLRSRRLHGVAFRRQHAIGPYVVDFCAPRHHLIIELDGSPHLGRKEEDLKRTQDLASQGYRVLRFWNDAVMNDIETVLGAILNSLRLA